VEGDRGDLRRLRHGKRWSLLRNRARQLGVATYIVRRQAAPEHLMARLTRVAPGRWALVLILAEK
jgi:hypothetical protein